MSRMPDSERPLGVAPTSWMPTAEPSSGSASTATTESSTTAADIAATKQMNSIHDAIFPLSLVMAVVSAIWLLRMLREYRSATLQAQGKRA